MDYRSYDRSYVISVKQKPDILGSSDSAFMGDQHKHNPEDLLVSSISSCHMLWYLHLCADAGIPVLSYTDKAAATMVQTQTGGAFREAVLRPEIRIAAGGDVEKAVALHDEAHRHCFIANSVNFPVRHEPRVSAG